MMTTKSHQKQTLDNPKVWDMKSKVVGLPVHFIGNFQNWCLQIMDEVVFFLFKTEQVHFTADLQTNRFRSQAHGTGTVGPRHYVNGWSVNLP